MEQDEENKKKKKGHKGGKRKEELLRSIFNQGDDKVGEGSGQKIKMEEKKGKEDGKEKGDKEVIKKGGKRKGLEVEKKKGKGEGKDCSLKSTSIAKVGAKEIGALGKEREFF